MNKVGLNIKEDKLYPWSGALGTRIKTAYPGDVNLWTSDEDARVFRVRTKDGYGFYGWLTTATAALRCVKGDE